MDCQLTEAEKGRRSAALAQAERQMSNAYRAGWQNRRAEVLLEETKEINGRVYWVGHTPQYIKAAVEAEESVNLGNQIVTGSLNGFLEEDIMLLK